MIVEQIYTGCLAQAAYYIENNGEAAIIDPLRDIDVYINKARQRNAKIKYIFETHFHADFVSGHVDLAKATGATIVYGPTAKPSFDALIATDGQAFKVGKRSIKVLHTPGHTMESCCYLLTNENGEDVILFSGDTLFLGDVGRPDLAQNDDITKEELAGLLYESIRDKILTLPDHIVIYPAHGAGSACGKNMSTDRFDTLGHQRQVNYALRKGITKREFMTEVTTGLTKPPQYFPGNVAINKGENKSIDHIIEEGTTPLMVNDFIAQIMDGSKMILDTRPAQTFAEAFIPGSINIGIDGDFAPWAGALITDIKQQILIVCETGKEKEVVIRLARVGYDNSIGYLEGGLAAWIAAGKPIETVKSIAAEELADMLEDQPVSTLLDVRRQSEFDSEHVIGAENTPLNYINDHISTLDPDNTYYIYCAAGYRSMIFASILKARGFKNVVDVQGGFKAIKDNGRLFISRYHDPTTML